MVKGAKQFEIHQVKTQGEMADSSDSQIQTRVSMQFIDLRRRPGFHQGGEFGPQYVHTEPCCVNHTVEHRQEKHKEADGLSNGISFFKGKKGKNILCVSEEITPRDGYNCIIAWFVVTFV